MDGAPNWTQFLVFKIAKFEFKVTVHYGLWEKAPSCDSLILFLYFLFSYGFSIFIYAPTAHATWRFQQASKREPVNPRLTKGGRCNPPDGFSPVALKR